MAIKNFAFLLLLLLQFHLHAQVYRGIKEVEPYKAKLSRIDSYLQLDPEKSYKEYDELTEIADKTNNKTLKTVLHIYRGTLLYYTGKNDSSVVYFDKAIDLATKIKNDQLLSTATIRKLFVIDGHSDAKIIVNLFKDEYSDAEKRKDTLNMIYALNGVAMNMERQDSVDQCINTYLKAMKLAEENHNDFEYGFLLNNLALMELDLNNPEGAYENIHKGLKIAKKLENIRLELVLRENLGYYYMKVDSVDQAEMEYQNALDLAQKRGYHHLAFNSYVNLGSVARKRGNPEKADSLLETALQQGLKDKLYYAVSPIFLNKAQIAISKGNYAEVDQLLDSAMFYAQYTSTNMIQEGVYVLKYQMYKKQKKFETALDFYQKLTKFRDSLDKDGHVQMMKELQLKYDVEKKEKQRIEEKNAYEKEISENELKNAILKQNIGIGIVVFLLIIGGFIIYYFREKQKREMEFSSAVVNKLEEERGRIARDLHDGLGQSLIVLKNKFNKLNITQTSETDNINENFTETIEQVRSISRTLIPPELRRLGLQKAILKMLQEVENSSLIITTSDIETLDEIELDSAQEIRLYRIIQELLNNTLKHSEASSLKIVSKIEDNLLTITYRDNGKGLDQDMLQKERNSIGLKSIDQRLRFLRGTIKYDKPTKGFKATITIKL